MITASNIHYELADRVQGLAAGGIGAMLLLARNRPDPRHRPQPPSPQATPALPRIRPRPEHRLQHPRRRTAPRTPRTAAQREVYLDALGTKRIPDPTTEGDFCRRFAERRPGPDGRHSTAPAARLVPATPRVLRPSHPRRRWHPRRHRRRVQAGVDIRLQRPVGLPPPDRFAGQHRRATLPGQPQRQPPLARAGRRLPGQGRRGCAGRPASAGSSCGATPTSPRPNTSTAGTRPRDIRFIFGFDAHAQPQGPGRATPGRGLQLPGTTPAV